MKRPAVDPIAQREREMAQAFAQARHHQPKPQMSVASSSSSPPPPPPPAGGVIAPHVSTERHRQPKRGAEHGVAAEQEALLHAHLRQQDHIEGVRARHEAVAVARPTRVMKRAADLDIGPVKQRTRNDRGHFESLSQAGYRLGPANHSFSGTAHRIM